MKKSLQAGFCVLIFLAVIVAPAVAENSAGNIRESMRKILAREGYIGKFANGQEMQRGVSAYLWDNRTQLGNSKFHRSKDVDAALCLMLSKGYPGLKTCADNKNFTDWCRQIVK